MWDNIDGLLQNCINSSGSVGNRDTALLHWAIDIMFETLNNYSKPRHAGKISGVYGEYLLDKWSRGIVKSLHLKFSIKYEKHDNWPNIYQSPVISYEFNMSDDTIRTNSFFH